VRLATPCMTFLTRQHTFKFKKSKPRFSDEEYQEYLMLKSSSQAQLCLVPSVSITCISQSLDSQGPWIIDLDASDHISGNASLFTFVFSKVSSSHNLSQWV